MYDHDSSNEQAPEFGPQFPIYPHLAQIVRTITSVSIGGNIYPGFIQQWQAPLTLRDREACYVLEPNFVPLTAGWYDARLIGNYLGRPLLATTCCAVGSSVSRSSSSSSPFPCTLVHTPLGAQQATGVTTLTLSGVTLPPGGLISVVASVTTPGSEQSLTATFNGQTMAPCASISCGDFYMGARLYIFSTQQLAPGTGNIVLTQGNPSVTSAITLQASLVTGLAQQVQYWEGDGYSALGSPPNYVLSIDWNTGVLMIPCEYQVVGYYMWQPHTLPAWNWSFSPSPSTQYSSAGQDLYQSYTGPSVAGTIDYQVGVSEGYFFTTTPTFGAPQINGVFGNPETAGFVPGIQNGCGAVFV